MSTAREKRLLRRDLFEHAGARRARCEIGIGKGRGKRSYSNESQARRAARNLFERYANALRAYRCACGAWHLTTKELRQ